MKKDSVWSFKFSTAVLALIPAAVAINYIGKLFAQTLKLPLWLDSIGTMLSAMMAGPVVGAICGMINNVIYGLTADPVSFVYSLTSIGIGFTVGILTYKGWINNIAKAVLLGLVAALISAIISTPLNVVFWGGTTGIWLGDVVFAFLIHQGSPTWIASFVDEFLVDIPDKIAVIIISFIIFKNLPKKLLILFKNDNKVEQL